MADLQDPIAIERSTMQAIVDAVRTRTKKGYANIPILVKAPTGATVFAKKDNVNYPGTESGTSGEFVVNVPEYGTYTVTAKNQTDRSSVTVTILTSNASIDLAPDGYHQLQYIETSGEQYIDTELVMPNGFRATGKLEFLTNPGGSTYQPIIGRYGYAGQHCNLYNLFEGSRTRFYIGNNNSARTADGTANIGISYDFDACNINGENSIILNGENASIYGAEVIYDGGDYSLPLYLFSAGDTSGAYNQLANVKLYGAFTVYSTRDDSGIVAKFLPTKRIDDGVIGMYDIVRQRFFTNAGTGEFIAGPEVT